MSATEETKAHFLASHGALHPHPERVRDPLFQRSAFFDPRDLVQVRYELLRRHLIDGRSVAEACRMYGMSRQMFYHLARAFQQQGFPGLLPRKRGPKRARKVTDEIVAYVAAERANCGRTPRQLAADVHREFGVWVHHRSLERGLARQEKKRR
jgi:transposase